MQNVVENGLEIIRRAENYAELEADDDFEIFL